MLLRREVIKDYFPLLIYNGCVNILSAHLVSLSYTTLPLHCQTNQNNSMARIPAKKAAPAAKAAPKKSSAKAKESKSPSQIIEAASESALAKLRELDIDQHLQAEIDWCLASYRSDGNPVGLYMMVERTIGVLRPELTKKRKGVTAKFIGDLEKALATR